MGNRVIETQQESMQTQSVQRVIAITIFHITTHRMPQVSTMDTYLILTSRLQLKLHQTVGCSSVKGKEMGNGILATIVNRRGICEIRLVVPEPVCYGTLILLHLS